MPAYLPVFFKAFLRHFRKVVPDYHERTTSVDAPITSAEDEPEIWYLSIGGSLSQDAEQVFRAQEGHQQKPHDGLSLADFPVFAARSFEAIMAFLPHCLGFEGKFERDLRDQWRSVGTVYFVVDGFRDIFMDHEEAKKMYDKVGNPTASIWAFPDLHIAKRRAEIAHAL
ncbi:hypothetical protein C8R43DRAFT_1123014 [Mycena crocata]|nr:hypothetical protein C8R43DRAFT_1123014 [Mycena crocata]